METMVKRESSMREVTITRKRGYYGKFRTLKLFVDDDLVGKIRQGETIVIKVPDQANAMVGKMDWGKTEALLLKDLVDGDALVVKAWYTLNIFRNIGISTIPMRIERRSENSSDEFNGKVAAVTDTPSG